MGLRFRRSVKICKGVKVNFGKTGASLTVGTKGVHKTFHTSGRVTTTVGLPGTGLYWTETSNPNKRSNQSANQQNQRRQSRRATDTPSFSSIIEPIQETSSARQPIFDSRSFATWYSESEQNSDDNVNKQVQSQEPAFEIREIRDIYRNADYPIDWIEISNSESAEEVDMDSDLWSYCKKMSDNILNGDVDAYLDVIETLRPVDDLLLYAGDFEFGTEKANTMTVEFTAKDNEHFSGNFREEYINAISVRVARDLLALLPVNKVEVITVDENGHEIANVIIYKRLLRNVNYNVMTATDIVSLMK